MEIDDSNYDLTDGSTTSALVLAILESRRALIMAIKQMEELMRHGAFVHRDDEALPAVPLGPRRVLTRPDRVDSAPVHVRTSPRRRAALSGLRLVDSDRHVSAPVS